MYDVTLYILAGMLAVGFVCNLLVRPVASRWWMAKDLAGTAAVAGGPVTGSFGIGRARRDACRHGGLGPSGVCRLPGGGLADIVAGPCLVPLRSRPLLRCRRGFPTISADDYMAGCSNGRSAIIRVFWTASPLEIVAAKCKVSAGMAITHVRSRLTWQKIHQPRQCWASPPRLFQLTFPIMPCRVTLLPELIQQVFATLMAAGTEQAEPERLQPAVPVKKSVFPEFIVCLEDGKKLKMLKRHLQTSYNMTPEQYRERWNLPHDYPMVAAEIRRAPVRTGQENRAGPQARGGSRCRAAAARQARPQPAAAAAA